MPDILQSKPSAEQSTFITGIQSRSCSYSSFYQYNDECMLSTLYDSHSIFFILWLQIFIIVFQQRFFKCQVNYCEIKALQYVILCDFFLPEVGESFYSSSDIPEFQEAILIFSSLSFCEGLAMPESLRVKCYKFSKINDPPTRWITELSIYDISLL